MPKPLGAKENEVKRRNQKIFLYKIVIGATLSAHFLKMPGPLSRKTTLKRRPNMMFSGIRPASRKKDFLITGK